MIDNSEVVAGNERRSQGVSFILFWLSFIDSFTAFLHIATYVHGIHNTIKSMSNNSYDQNNSCPFPLLLPPYAK